MSPTEFAFLALGLVLGAAIGAALVEAVRIRPAPGREVRVTVAPNSIAARRPRTLNTTDPDAGRHVMPGSPEAGAWVDVGPGPGTAGQPVGPAPIPGGPGRTIVPSAPVARPAAVAIPVRPERASGRSAGPGAVALAARPPAPAGPPRMPTVFGIIEELVAATRPVTPEALPGALDVGAAGGRAGVRIRPPAPRTPLTLDDRSIGVPVTNDEEAAMPAWLDDHPRPMALATPREPTGGDRPAAGNRGGAGSVPEPRGTDACADERRLAAERCALAETAREKARGAAEALRDGQRAYDDLREKVDSAHALADPREIRAAKDAAHRAFRAARAAASGAEDAEAAARDWLHEINRINTAAREALHVVEAGSADLRAQVPRLERLAVEADAARIAAEAAQAGCREAQEALARCEERAHAAPPLPPEAPTFEAPGWPGEPEPGLQLAVDEEDLSRVPLVLRVLRGDRAARERLVATLAGGDAEAGRAWRMRLADLLDAIAARAIEDGFLDFPDQHPFWGMFSIAERRDIVGALSALGFRFDGLGAFADGRVPAQRDLSLAVGYAGLDRMRIRRWPHEEDLGELYREATVGAGEWLATEAGDLSLGRMVDALGGRAGELADVWNAWGRVRPALLETG